MSGGPHPKVETGPPDLAQGIGGGIYHAGKALDAVELAEFRVRQNGPDRVPKSVVINRPDQAAGQSRRQLLECHDLEAVPALACGGETGLTQRKPIMDDNCPTLCRWLHRDHPFRRPGMARCGAAHCRARFS